VKPQINPIRYFEEEVSRKPNPR